MPIQSSDRPGAVIVGGAHGSVAVARSLGRNGIPVWFVKGDHPIARYSRYVRKSFSIEGLDPEDAVAFLLDLADRKGLKGAVLFAAGDSEMKLVAQHHAALSAVFRLTIPTWDVVQWAYDKRLTYRRAAMLAIDCPWSYYPRDYEDVAQLECRFPLILKPTVNKSRNAFTAAKAWRVDDRAALLSRYLEAESLVGADAIVLQELISGGGPHQFSYAAVWDRGNPVASLVARRTRQYPIDFGYTSTFVETVEQQEIEDAASRFLRSLGYSGLVEIEFKYDERDGRYKILDVNARAWAWIGLGALAGVDFPHIAWRLATGESVARTQCHTSASWIHAARDIIAGYQEIAAGTLSPANYLRSLHRPFAFAAFAKDDPLPGLIELPLVMSRVLMRRVRSVANSFRSQNSQAALSSPPRSARVRDVVAQRSTSQ